MTFAQMCRQLGPNVLAFWRQLLSDENAPLPVRVRASELISERGFGKSVSVVEMNITHAQPVRALTDEELNAIASGQQPRIPLLLDGEYDDVTADLTARGELADATP